MTHLSDFSYLQRVTVEIYMIIFLISRVWANDRFQCLHPKRILSGELRSIVTIMYFLTIIMQMSWDIMSTWIKYSESFIEIPHTNTFISKPFMYWTPRHQQIAMAIDYVECVTLSLQTGIFFLLQCFWNYLSNNVAKRSFMGSWEFIFYIVWALGSMAAFPILQWYYRDDVTKREAIPQLAYSAEILIAAILGVRSHFRFKRIINITRNMKSGGTAIIGKIGYFKDMNLFMTAVLFLMSISLGILCVDGLTSGSTINSNKFATDLLTGNCDTCVIFLWIIGISIFHPRRSTDEVGVSTFSKSESHNHDIENKASSKFGTSFASNNDLHPSSNLSQRVANFIDNRNSGPAQTSNQFLRPMSPMEVDYPIVSVPNNKFVLAPNSKRYNMQPTGVSSEAPPSPKSQDYPMQTISGAAVAAVATGGHDFGFHPIIDKNSNEYDYLRTESNWARRPSFK